MSGRRHIRAARWWRAVGMTAAVASVATVSSACAALSDADLTLLPAAAGEASRPHAAVAVVPAAPTPQASQPTALRAAKALVVGDDGREVRDHVWVLMRDGAFAGLLDAWQAEPPAEYARVDLGDAWVMPGMVDLHSHVGGTFDINGPVYQSNSELRVSPAVIPGNRSLRRGLASGVTTVLFIPGSATTVGGQGVLIKTGFETYDRTLVRDPGSLKVAQADNPKRWGYRMQRSMLNWQVRDTMRRGVGYAKRWEAFERGEGPKPRIDLQFEIFRALRKDEAQISTHTQVAQVVLASIQIMVVEHGLPMFIDHGSFDAWRIAEVAEREGVPAILGPRNFNSEVPGRGIDADGRIDGIAGRYQEKGHSTIGFNTDAPVIPQEELSLQAGMAVRFGFEDRNLNTVRGLTIVPAQTVGLGGRLGSIHPGKDADLLVVDGHPADPRTTVRSVWLEGELVYDAERDGRLW
ncbi:MAG: amidohydrolase family protein [Planctomycetota bacterium]